MSKDVKEFVFKIVVLGDAAVGKTSLINMYIEQSFSEDYKPTLGANIIRKDVHVDSINASVRLIMWDLAGQEKYNVIRSMYFQGCVGALLVYDLTQYSSFDQIKIKWLEDFKKFSRPDGVYILIGNKSDLKGSIKVSYEEGKSLSQEINAAEFIETSAKYGDNVENAFKKLVLNILKRSGVEFKEN